MCRPLRSAPSFRPLLGRREHPLLGLVVRFLFRLQRRLREHEPIPVIIVATATLVEPTGPLLLLVLVGLAFGAACEACAVQVLSEVREPRLAALLLFIRVAPVVKRFELRG